MTGFMHFGMQGNKSTFKHDNGEQMHSLVLSTNKSWHPIMLTIWSGRFHEDNGTHIRKWVQGISQYTEALTIHDYGKIKYFSIVCQIVRRPATQRVCQLPSSGAAAQRIWEQVGCANYPTLSLEKRRTLAIFPCGEPVWWMITGKNFIKLIKSYENIGS